MFVNWLFILSKAALKQQLRSFMIMRPYHQMGHCSRQTWLGLWRQKSLDYPHIRGGFCAKKSLSFLTIGYLFSTGSHKQPNWLKNKQIAVLEIRINLLFHSVFTIFFDAPIFFNDLRKTANFTIWDYYKKKQLCLSCLLDLEIIIVPDVAG